MRKSSSHYLQFLEPQTISENTSIRQFYQSIILLITFQLEYMLRMVSYFQNGFHYNKLVNNDNKISYFQNKRKYYLSLRSRNYSRSSALQQFFCIFNCINNSSLIVIIFKQLFKIGVCAVNPFCVVPLKKTKCCLGIILDHIYCVIFDRDF